MPRVFASSLRWLAVISSLTGNPSVLAAQPLSTIAAAANLNFALTEVTDQFARPGFHQYLQETDVRAILRRHGFAVPQ